MRIQLHGALLLSESVVPFHVPLRLNFILGISTRIVCFLSSSTLLLSILFDDFMPRSLEVAP